MIKYNFEQRRNDYLTPPPIIKEIFNELKNLGIEHDNIFSLDTCASKRNIPACFHYIEGTMDGLDAGWFGISYCNPPYDKCDRWVKKAYSEFKKGVICVLLIPARTETAYWQKYILQNGYTTRTHIKVKFLRKGLKFLNPDTHEEMGIFKNALALVIMDGSHYTNKTEVENEQLQKNKNMTIEEMAEMIMSWINDYCVYRCHKDADEDVIRFINQWLESEAE